MELGIIKENTEKKARNLSLEEKISLVKEKDIASDEEMDNSSFKGGISIDNLIENAFSDDLINMAFNQDNM